jgi:hypothetical protein
LVRPVLASAASITPPPSIRHPAPGKGRPAELPGRGTRPNWKEDLP